jgi:hypothetical protein
MHLYVYICIYKSSRWYCFYAFICIYIYKNVQDDIADVHLLRVRQEIGLYMFLRVYICMHVCMHIYICIYKNIRDDIADVLLSRVKQEIGIYICVYVYESIYNQRVKLFSYIFIHVPTLPPPLNNLTCRLTIKSTPNPRGCFI